MSEFADSDAYLLSRNAHLQAAEEPAEQGTGDGVAEPVAGVGRPNATMYGGAHCNLPQVTGRR